MISVATCAGASGRSLPTMLLWSGAHAISMCCWFEDSRNKEANDEVTGVEVNIFGMNHEPGVTSNAVCMAAWLSAKM